MNKNIISTEEKFLNLISKNSNGCWIPDLPLKDGRFGNYRFEGRKIRPQTVCWRIVKGVYPSRRLMRTCREKNCVNPDHHIEALSIHERFLAKVRVGDDERNPCWVWTGAKNRLGYGFMKSDNGGNVMAHRFSYEYYLGTIPDGFIVMHSCDNPPCVNPAHLSAGTHYENSKDRDRKGRNKYKLTPDQVKEMREKFRQGRSISSLGREYGIRGENAAKILSGEAWAWV